MGDEDKGQVYFDGLFNRAIELEEVAKRLNKDLGMETQLDQQLKTLAIKSTIHAEPFKNSIPDDIAEVVIGAIDLTGYVKRQTIDYNEAWQINQQKKREDHRQQIDLDKLERQAERHDMWKLWAHKTIRWALGGVTAVLLYSAAVWAAEKSDFIKVPIRDMVVENNNE